LPVISLLSLALIGCVLMLVSCFSITYSSNVVHIFLDR
jgi:hypothetical protein